MEGNLPLGHSSDHGNHFGVDNSLFVRKFGRGLVVHEA